MHWNPKILLMTFSDHPKLWLCSGDRVDLDHRQLQPSNCNETAFQCVPGQIRQRIDVLFLWADRNYIPGNHCLWRKQNILKKYLLIQIITYFLTVENWKYFRFFFWWQVGSEFIGTANKLLKLKNRKLFWPFLCQYKYKKLWIFFFECSGIAHSW